MKIEKEHKKSTLMNMTKNQLSELVMCLEYNNNVLHDVINQQYKSFIALLPKWIPVTEELPENEQEVDIAIKTKIPGSLNDVDYIACRGFYEDGTLNTDDSKFLHYEYTTHPDDNGDSYASKGWYELSKYANEGKGDVNEIEDRDQVVAWRKIEEGYKPE